VYNSVLLINTMKINEGELEEFKASVQRAVSFVEANAPQLMVQVYTDEENLRAYSFQLYPDSESILTHWKLTDPYIADVSKHITVERLDFYGQPNETVMQGMTPTSRDGVTVTVTPRFTGFGRFAANQASTPTA
jgi:hypothetical protein